MTTLSTSLTTARANIGAQVDPAVLARIKKSGRSHAPSQAQPTGPVSPKHTMCDPVWWKATVQHYKNFMYGVVRKFPAASFSLEVYDGELYLRTITTRAEDLAAVEHLPADCIPGMHKTLTKIIGQVEQWSLKRAKRKNTATLQALRKAGIRV